MLKLHSGRNSWPVGTSGNLEKKFRKFFFLPKEFYLFFLDYLICYLQVLVQKYLHCILTKILDLSEKRAFSYKHCLFFLFYFFNFFYRIFHVYLRSLNILPTSFQAKMKTLHSFRNSWPVGTRGMFVQNLTKIFFFFLNNFPFFSWTTKYSICKFSFKNADNIFLPKFLISWTKWHFRTNLMRVFFYFLIFLFMHIYLFIEFSRCFWDL